MLLYMLLYMLCCCQTHRRDFTVVVLVREVSGQTKITNLESEVFSYEDVACRQVTMYTLQAERAHILYMYIYTEGNSH